MVVAHKSNQQKKESAPWGSIMALACGDASGGCIYLFNMDGLEER